MRRRPEDCSLRRSRRSLSCAAVAAFAVASVLAAEVACAQAGAGAERYEVTITPPKRPGSEKPADAAAPTGAEPGAAATSPSVATGSAAAPDAVAPPSSATASPSSATASPSSAAGAAAAASEAARAPSNLPLRTLQVGAYRQRDRAESLQDALSPTFQDVAILEVQSGGEPLYRVNVGRLPRGPALDDLKRRLATAGFPAFEILAPTATPKN